MVVFNVYEPPNAWGDRTDRAERLVFIKDGFYWFAAIIPALWFLVKGLWLEFIVFLAAIMVLSGGLEVLGAKQTASGLIILVVQVLIGFEASTIYAGALERRRYRLVGTVTGRDKAECERRFIETWLPSQDQRGAPPPDVSMPPPPALPSWTRTALDGLNHAIARGRRQLGVKA